MQTQDLEVKGLDTVLLERKTQEYIRIMRKLPVFKLAAFPSPSMVDPDCKAPPQRM